MSGSLVQSLLFILNSIFLVLLGVFFLNIWLSSCSLKLNLGQKFHSCILPQKKIGYPKESIIKLFGSLNKYSVTILYEKI